MSSPNSADPGRPGASSPTLTAAAHRLFDDSGLARASTARADPDRVAEVLLRSYGMTGRLHRIATEKDDTFRLRGADGDHLVKVAPLDEPAATVDLQSQVMLHLQGRAPEIPAQRLVRTRDGACSVACPTGEGPRRLRVLGFVRGAMLADTRPDADALHGAGRLLARLDTALASFAHPADGRRLVWDLQHLPLLAELAEQVTESPAQRELATEAIRRFGAEVVPRLPELETQVIHGDFSPFNVVVDPDEPGRITGVIDFGDCVRSAVLFDPAVAMANLVTDGPDPWARPFAFLHGYLAVRPLRAAERELLLPAVLARIAQRALVHGWRASWLPERRDYLLAHAAHDWTNLQAALDTPPPVATTHRKGPL